MKSMASVLTKAFVNHLDEKNWFDSTYIGFDERRNMETALDLIDVVKNKDGFVLKNLQHLMILNIMRLSLTDWIMLL